MSDDVIKDLRKAIQDAKAIQNEGKWIRDGHHIICGKCGITMCDTDREGDKIPTNFCPNCGVKMINDSDNIPDFRTMDNWKDTDLWKFTADNPSACVEAWGGYIGKNDGYTPYGFTVEHKNKIYYFGLDGHYIKEKAL